MSFTLGPEEKTATLDTINRFRKDDPGLERVYEVEFYLDGAGKKHLSRLEGLLTSREVEYDDLDLDNGEITLTIEMHLDYDSIIRLEEILAEYSEQQGLDYGGWGAYE